MPTPTKKNLVNLWTELASPLRYLTKSQIRIMLDMAKQGNDARLQVAFYDMERTMPIYGVVIQRRLAGIQNRRWKISPLFPDASASVEQAAAVEEKFKEADLRNELGLTEAIRHLSMASFRGRSAVKPVIDGGDLLFYNLENWNVLEWNRKLYFCQDALETAFLPSVGEVPKGVVEIPKGELAVIREDRPVDIPGIEIYLRQTIGEDAWSRATERYGLAQVVITAPEGTPDSALPMWAERAMRIYEGGTGVLPPGAGVNQLTDARGQDPFSRYIEHQTEMIVLLACGSTLGTLAGATGLGSGLAELQDSTFKSLVDFDCKRIANALTDSAVRKVVRDLGGKETLCRFEFVDVNKLSGEKAWSIAKEAKDKGYSVDLGMLKENYPELSFINEDTPDKTATVPDDPGPSLNDGETWEPGNAPTVGGSDR